MKIKFFSVALCMLCAATAFQANAQKSYTSGLITLTTDARGQQIDAKDYFSPDSSALSFTTGPATIKVLTNAQFTFFAVLVDVPVASIKKAAIATPDELDQITGAMPKFTFATDTATKTISGFKCNKVVATDPKTNKTYDVWVTHDVTLPEGAIPKYYHGIDGVPIQYTSFSQGQSADVTVKSITDEKAPAGTFAISADFDKITLDDLKAMSGGGGN